MTPFSGVQIYRRTDGTLGIAIFKDGMIVAECEPNERDQTRELGFYDLKHNRVADPAIPED